VAAEPIGTQHGLTAAGNREVQLHPAYQAAWDKRTLTLLELVRGHNEALQRLAALEDAVFRGPFG
jgi:hypothetical protein